MRTSWCSLNSSASLLCFFKVTWVVVIFLGLRNRVLVGTETEPGQPLPGVSGVGSKKEKH